MKFIKDVLRNYGLDISRFQPSPYEDLREFERFKEITVKLLGDDFKIADAQSFYWSFREIFLDQIYKFESSNDQPVIIDCGSNYGTSIVFFKDLYPMSRILGVEADPITYRLLEWNLNRRGYKNLKLYNRAISVNQDPVIFHHEGADGGRIVPLPPSSTQDVFVVEPVMLDELIQGHVDFLKMDIEGVEVDVICSSIKLVDVDQLFLEYHSFKDSKQELGRLLEKLSSLDFRYYLHTKFCSPLPLTEETLQLGMDLQVNIFAKKQV